MRPTFARHYDQFIGRMEQAWLRDARARLLDGLHGTVLELGAGTGRNLAHYPDTVERLVLTEPSSTMRDQLATHLDRLRPGIEVEIVDATADRLPLGDDEADAVVSTLVLCSVPALGPAVAEVRRVLRPGGELRLIEHVAAERPWARRIQRALDPAWSWLEGSCHLDHETRVALAAGGFDVDDVDEAIEPKMPPLFHRIARGRATLPA
jgi:ubiquinone/menaquinone biosynthesis C-methylase UbiE